MSNIKSLVFTGVVGLGLGVAVGLGAYPMLHKHDSVKIAAQLPCNDLQVLNPLTMAITEVNKLSPTLNFVYTDVQSRVSAATPAGDASKPLACEAKLQLQEASSGQVVDKLEVAYSLDSGPADEAGQVKWVLRFEPIRQASATP